VDIKNKFETDTTFTLMRLEWLAAFVVSVVLAVINISSIRWPVFVFFFVIIDAVGYIPGAIAYRRSRDKHIPRTYYVLYNTAHSLVTEGAAVGLWCLFVRPEWALLAVPIHLFGDRGLFGNTLKPFGVPFEPHPVGAFERFRREYAAATAAVAGLRGRSSRVDDDVVRA
jgi:hypothetical protein